MVTEMEGAKRYAQCHFVDMSHLKRFMLGEVCCNVSNFAKVRSIDANMKSLKIR